MPASIRRCRAYRAWASSSRKCRRRASDLLKTPRIALLDGDILAYRAASAVQQQVYWDDEDTEPTVFADAARAARSACETARAWTELAGCNKSIVFFTGRANWRKAILPTYKANRSGKVKPVAYLHTVQKITEAFDTRVVEGLEADDLIGIMGTRQQYQGAIMVSLDKDFRTIPGLHFNPMKERKPALVTPQEADRFWLYQALIGDTTDNYKGCPGIGPKKADSILRNGGFASQWAAVVAAFQAKGMTERDALVQARVARILRDEDYNKSTKEVRLWSPSGGEWRPLSELIAPSPKPGRKAAPKQKDGETK